MLSKYFYFIFVDLKRTKESVACLHGTSQSTKDCISKSASFCCMVKFQSLGLLCDCGEATELVAQSLELESGSLSTNPCSASY